MKIFLFIWQWKMREYYSPQNWKRLLIIFFTVLFVGLYAYLTAILFDEAHLGKIDLNPDRLLQINQWAILVIPILLKFFPFYVIKQAPISCHYPIPKNKIALIDLVAFSLTRPVVAALTIYVLLFCSLSQYSTLEISFNHFLFLSFGFLVAENLGNAISWGNKVYKMLLLSIFACLLIGIFLSSSFPAVFFLFLGLDLLLLALWFCFYSAKLYQLENVDVTIPLLNKCSYVKISMTNFLFRRLFFLAITAKTVFMFFIAPKVPEFTKITVLFLVGCPLYLFTYIFNNLWGILKTTAITISITNNSFEKYVDSYFKLIIPALLIDFIITLFSMHLLKNLNLKFLLCWLNISVALVSLGILISFLQFFEVKLSLFNLKGTTSQVFIAVFFPFAIAIGYCFNENMYLIIGHVGLSLISIGAWLYMKANKKSICRRFKSKLFWLGDMR
ncbi:hypothetical protein QTN47_13315 [Danxiaibacter flavus]|uniref:Uncharacterized protein n=1 Tax=Danxiaibacter flavus TaxID=3049108 RepID=A0ABV3ZHD2_9BACT|nr:hypothetical protein QNM32_13320 [Chitinophagaceae bacterium DXS]